MSGLSVKALGLALGANRAEKWGGKPPLATCTNCAEPLISTLVWPGSEFVCICCGLHLGFVDPEPQVDTPELRARYEELKAEWDEAKVTRHGPEEMGAWLAERVGA